MNRTHRIAVAIPRMPMKRKTDCQPYQWVIHPMMGANMTVAKYWDELKMADAVPRSLVGNHAETIRPFPGNVGAKENPIKNSKANNTTKAKRPFKNPVKPIRQTKKDHEKNAMP